jgi:hypothetical protein
VVNRARDQAGGEKVADKIQQAGDRHQVQADVSKATDIKRLFVGPNTALAQ